MTLGSPPFVLDAPGRVGNLLAADLHRSIGLSAAPPSLWPGRELRKCHCLEVPGGWAIQFSRCCVVSGKSIPEIFLLREWLGVHLFTRFGVLLVHLSVKVPITMITWVPLWREWLSVTVYCDWLSHIPSLSSFRHKKCRQTVAVSSKLLLSAGIPCAVLPGSVLFYPSLWSTISSESIIKKGLYIFRDSTGFYVLASAFFMPNPCFPDVK